MLRRSSFSSSSSRSAGGGGAGQPAKDANGNEIKKAAWLKTHLPGDHTLSQGLKVSEWVTYQDRAEFFRFFSLFPWPTREGEVVRCGRRGVTQRRRSARGAVSKPQGESYGGGGAVDRTSPAKLNVDKMRAGERGDRLAFFLFFSVWILATGCTGLMR